ncbi:hypothetical protein, partial [Achromobacter xylosoxidans]|uniref:hypothetical protein n=1 Tax=Alcaligenes xylosoxydans xylosoxydans TaxID=85698 RepID=UPI001F0DD4BC
HNHPDVQAAMHAQIDALAYAHTSFFTTEVAERLAATLVADAPRRRLLPIGAFVPQSCFDLGQSLQHLVAATGREPRDQVFGQ